MVESIVLDRKTHTHADTSSYLHSMEILHVQYKTLIFDKEQLQWCCLVPPLTFRQQQTSIPVSIPSTPKSTRTFLLDNRARYDFYNVDLLHKFNIMNGIDLSAVQKPSLYQWCL